MARSQIESIKAARASRAVRDLDHAEEIKTKLEAQPVAVKVRAGAGGRLFGAVTVGEIADALAETSGESVDKRTIVVDQPDQGAGHPRGVGEAARRRLRHRRAERHPRLT